MSTENDGRFKLSRNDEAPSEDLIRSEIDELRIEKLNHRVTFITILIPCIVIVLLVVAYLDIKRRVITTQTSGIVGVESLSRDLESRFSSLSLRQAKLEEALSKSTESSTADSAQISVQLKKIDGAINSMQKAKPDRKEVDERIQNLKSALGGVQKSVDEINKKFAPLETELKKTMETLAVELGEARRLVEDLHEKVSEISATKMGKNELDLAMKIETLRLQEMLNENTRSLEEKMTALEKRIDKKLKETQSAVTRSGETKPPTPPPPATGGTSENSTQTPAPNAGNILEQDIQ